ncbi:MAG: hypothetical protein AAF637_13270 [Pseudomonadota bacterium]
MSTYAQDIEFVFSEAARFARMNAQERRELSPFETLCTLPHSSGRGHSIIGTAAHERLAMLSERAVARSPKYSGRIDPEAVLQELRRQIVHRFVREGRELSTKEADRAVSSSIKAAGKACADRTHYVPCNLVDDEAPTSFSIGPVTFCKRSMMWQRLERPLQAYLEQCRTRRSRSGEILDRRELAEMLISDAREYYGSFQWVAVVVVDGCDPPTSQRTADRTVQSTLDCIHLLLGETNSKYMVAGGRGAPCTHPDRRGRIVVGPACVAEVSGLIDSRRHKLGEEWWDTLNADGRDEYVALMGAAIEAGQEATNTALLARRFLDAVAWFGQATRDDSAASSVVKYVTAVERILVTKTKDPADIANTLAERGAALIFDPHADDLESLRDRFKKIYGVRSALVHGSKSPTDAYLAPHRHEAENLTRLMLLRALEFFGRRGLEAHTVTDRYLEERYNSRCNWAEQYGRGGPRRAGSRRD